MSTTRHPVYEAPEHTPSTRRHTQPIDMNYLAGATGGYKVMAEEMLLVFSRQANLLARSLDAQTDMAARQELAKTLQETAYGIGAFALAELAGVLAHKPADAEVLACLIAHVDETRDFIASLTR